MELIDYIVKETLRIISNEEPLKKVVDNYKNILNGLYLELGVWNGDSINYVASKLNSWDIFGFDSFEGLPEKWREGYDKGFFTLNGKLPKVNKNVTLIKGWFDDSLPIWFQHNVEKFNKIDILHIDCDLYSSTAVSLNILKPMIKTGTILIFDEMINYQGFQDGEIKAFSEFIKETKCRYEILYAGGYNSEKVAIKII